MRPLAPANRVIGTSDLIIGTAKLGTDKMHLITVEKGWRSRESHYIMRVDQVQASISGG
ncbi:hypothetical protein J31TS3_00310 [Paenibacillus lactis]|nr:hypothetical protein J31TS3_00310 [Paenibacillus lactis]